MVECMDPPPPDCPECHTAPYCMPMDSGCPPPPVYCDYEAGEMNCYEAPPPDCGANCFGHEFCVNMTEGCPPPQVHCMADEMTCSMPAEGSPRTAGRTASA